MKSIQDRIKDYFDITWSREDFEEGYKTAKEIEDRELTDGEWEDFDEQMSEERLKRFREVIIADINERLVYFFE